VGIQSYPIRSEVELKYKRFPLNTDGIDWNICLNASSEDDWKWKVSSCFFDDNFVNVFYRETVWRLISFVISSHRHFVSHTKRPNSAILIDVTLWWQSDLIGVGVLNGGMDRSVAHRMRMWFRRVLEKRFYPMFCFCAHSILIFNSMNTAVIEYTLSLSVHGHIVEALSLTLSVIGPCLVATDSTTWV